jgi:transposase-like protein
MASAQTVDRWHAVIDRYEDSGQSLRDFAEANGVNRNTLAWWRWELGRSSRTATPSFVELVADERQSSPATGAVVVDLGDSSARVVVGPSTDLPLLRRVAEALC